MSKDMIVLFFLEENKIIPGIINTNTESE